MTNDGVNPCQNPVMPPSRAISAATSKKDGFPRRFDLSRLFFSTSRLTSSSDSDSDSSFAPSLFFTFACILVTIVHIGSVINTFTHPAKLAIARLAAPVGSRPRRRAYVPLTRAYQ